MPDSSGSSERSPASLLWKLIFAAGLLLHVAGIFQPLLGNFAQHQTDYATVVQRWLATSIDPFNPVMRFIGEGQNRLFYGDFPLNITLTAWAVKLTGLPIAVAGRGLSAVFFLLSLFPFRQIARRFSPEPAVERWAFLFYLYSPLTLIYGQSFLLEMSALAYGLFTYYFFLKAFEGTGSGRHLVLAGVSASLMLATRIYFAPLLLPLAVYLFYRQGARAFLRKEGYLFLVLALLLPVAWQVYAGTMAAARGDESSLLDNLRVFSVKSDPVLEQEKTQPDYFLPILRIAALKVVTPVGLVLAALGMFFHPRRLRNGVLLAALVLAAFLPLMIFVPRKFVEFEYYFLPFVPALAILGAACIAFLMERNYVSALSRGVLAAGVVLLGLRFSLAPVFIIPAEDRPVLKAAAKVRELTPPETRVIAAHGSSTSFLYHTNRDGWAFYPAEEILAVRNQADVAGTPMERVERFRQQGAAYFAIANKDHFRRINPDFLSALRTRFSIVHEDADSLIFSLGDRHL